MEFSWEHKRKSTHLWTSILIKKPEMNTGGKKTASPTNGAGQTECLLVENYSSILITPHKTQLQKNQGLQHKTRYTESGIR